jgi:hypothetical protein
MCEEMIKSFKETTTGESDLVLGLSANDPHVEDYLKLANRYNLGIYIEDTNSITKIFNSIWEMSNNKYIAYHMTNDDVLYQSPEWDKFVVYFFTKLYKKGGIMYGDDQFHGMQLCTLPIISANICDALGWLQYDALGSLFGDAVWMHIGMNAECLHYISNFKTEHRHWINEKRENDNLNYREHLKRDEFIFNFWKQNLADEAIVKVKELIK